MKLIKIIFIIIAVFSSVPSLGADPLAAQCPVQFKPLYKELDDKLEAFDKLIQSQENKNKQIPLFAASLLTANAHRGKQLLNPGVYEGVLLELKRLKDLGVNAVVVSVGFPMLYRPFYASEKEYRGYLDFYKRLSRDVRAYNMKLIIESGVIFSKGGFAESEKRLSRYYKKMGLRKYVRARAAMLVEISRQLSPDYLSVGAEPDTEAEQSGKKLNDPKVYARIVNYFIATLSKKSVLNMPVGSGVGTWHPRYKEFIDSFCRNTRVDFVDIHIYPVNRDFLTRAIEIAEIVKKYGKKITITEAWLYKAREEEMGKGVTVNEFFVRDNFSFWQELDSKFIRYIVSFSKIYGFEFISFFWTRYFFGYIDYEGTFELTSQKINEKANKEIAANIIAGNYTSTAQSYRKSIEEASSQ
ncbi:MAG: glycosyl hydrolase [Candidatus Omnitrophota bacterium]